jgi:hypothetical protein
MAAVCWIHLLHTEREMCGVVMDDANSIGIGIRISSQRRQHVVVIPNGLFTRNTITKNSNDTIEYGERDVTTQMWFHTIIGSNRWVSIVLVVVVVVVVPLRCIHRTNQVLYEPYIFSHVLLDFIRLVQTIT